jgi:prevent-host-death family protein
MKQVNIYEAKTQLSRLVEEVEGGEEVVIARAGKPVARLVPFEPAGQPREPGGWKGGIWIADDFDAPLPEDLQRLFEGGDE